MEVLVAQSCRTLCDPMDCSPPVSSVHRILQAGILQWAAISSSRGPSWPRDWAQAPALTGRCFTVWATREGHVTPDLYPKNNLLNSSVYPKFINKTLLKRKKNTVKRTQEPTPGGTWWPVSAKLSTVTIEHSVLRRSVVSDSATPWTAARQAPLRTDSPGRKPAVGCHLLLQGPFLTQGSNPPLLRPLPCRQILYH